MMEMTKGLWIALIVAILLFCIGAKNGWDRDITTPVCTFIYGSTLTLGFAFGLGAKYLKLLLE